MKIAHLPAEHPADAHGLLWIPDVGWVTGKFGKLSNVLQFPRIAQVPRIWAPGIAIDVGWVPGKLECFLSSAISALLPDSPRGAIIPVRSCDHASGADFTYQGALVWACGAAAGVVWAAWLLPAAGVAALLATG